jgi:Spy/CpxP family protein refolding chaperone
VPQNVSSWLDQNVDPSVQRQFYQRFADMTPEQKAKIEQRMAQRMQRWFDQRRQPHEHPQRPRKNQH